MDGERRIVKKCRVLVRKLKLGEIREREEKHSEHILNQNNGANGSNRSPHTRVESENMRKRDKRSQKMSSSSLATRFSKRNKIARRSCQNPEARLCQNVGDCDQRLKKGSVDTLRRVSVKEKISKEKFDQQINQMIEKVPMQWHCKQCGKITKSKHERGRRWRSWSSRGHLSN